MKINFTHLQVAFVGLSFLLLFQSCSKEKDDNDDIYVITGNANSNAAGAPEAKAFGAISGGYSARYKKVAFNIVWKDLSSAPKGSAFYFAGALQADSVIKIFPVTEGNDRSGLTAGEMFITDEQASELMNGKWTYSVNTSGHPHGEIKGRVILSRSQ
jgi:hypothetical protein